MLRMRTFEAKVTDHVLKITAAIKPKIISFGFDFDAVYILPRKIFIYMQERLKFNNIHNAVNDCC